MSALVRTTCPYCGVGCGVTARRESSGAVEIKGDPEHPANFGRLCSKGSALGETMGLSGRLLAPSIAGRAAAWDEALDLVAGAFAAAIAEHGPDSVAFYVSGQILIEDYYVANKLMKGFIGSGNIDTNSRLCMSSSVAGHKRAFGSDTVPGCYEDLEAADLVVLVGSNLAWCHPVLFQRLAAARAARGTKVVVVDPRSTATCEIADIHLALAPGSDVALFNGLLLALAGGNATRQEFIGSHTTGFADAFKAASRMSYRDIAEVTGIDVVQLCDFYDLFLRSERVVTVYSQGVNQSTSGTDKVNAIINCHLATGRIGKPGMGPFSVTGQPNAMGGREVGGLANMLAAHMDIDNAAHRAIVSEFWEAPRLARKPGLKAVDLFRAVEDQRIKALWIMGTNPAASMPDADRVRAAIAACPFVVVSDTEASTDTTEVARVLLPSLAWGEKSGTVTNSERRISRQRSFMPPPGEARADWWQLAEVGKRMGHARAFAWSSPAEIFDEYARLTAAGNGGGRDLDLGDLAGLSDAAYDAFAPVQWPGGRARMFADGRFFTEDGRARFVATPFRGLERATSPEFPYVLNTGRVRDQWHTMTRTGRSPRLLGHVGEPFVAIHPDDARQVGVEAATLARIRSSKGEAILRVVVSPQQRCGSLFAPMHWTGQHAPSGRIDALVAGDTDPVSGQPALKAMPVAIAPFEAAWYGFAVLSRRPATPAISYSALASATAGWRLELAGEHTPDDWGAFARALFGVADGLPLIAYHDRSSGQHRLAAFEGERLAGALFVGPAPVAVSRTWAASMLAQSFADTRARLTLLAGRAGADVPDKGAIVCACFEVGRNEIESVVRSGRCTSIASVGDVVKAGSNCGSCRAEIGRLIDACRIPQAV